jgi:hypothetical protein
MPDAPVMLENAIAAELGKLGARVRIFADAFRKEGGAQQRINVLVGHSGSEHIWATEYPAVAGFEVASFEIRVESADIKNHQAAFSYLSAAMGLLRGFEPITNIRPILPFRYAPNGYDTQAGVWSYTGIVRAQIMRPATYEFLEDIEPTELITVGLWRDGYTVRTFEVDLLEDI